MGAWNEEPTGNDEAQEWIVNSVEQPMIDAIKTALSRFLEDSSDDVQKAEAEVAVALLLDITAKAGGFRYVQLDASYIASEQGLWHMAVEAIKSLLLQKKWLAEWGNPQKKTDVLNQLLAELETGERGEKKRSKEKVSGKEKMSETYSERNKAD